MRTPNGNSQICYYLLLAVIFIGTTYGSYDDLLGGDGGGGSSSDDDDDFDAASDSLDRDGVTAYEGKNHHRNYREPYGECESVCTVHANENGKHFNL